MPRRTKLIIAALFLLLTGIAITGVVLSWHPQSSLRFTLNVKRASEPLSASFSPFAETPSLFYVQVENAGSTPVLLHGATLSGPLHATTRRSELEAFIDPNEPFASDPPEDPVHWLIPPHSSIRCAVLCYQPDGKDIAQRGVSTVEYAWGTPLRHRCVRTLAWVRRHLPAALQEFIPGPDYLRDSTALEVPPPPAH